MSSDSCIDEIADQRIEAVPPGVLDVDALAEGANRQNLVGNDHG